MNMKFKTSPQNQGAQNTQDKIQPTADKMQTHRLFSRRSEGLDVEEIDVPEEEFKEIFSQYFSTSS